MMDSVDEVQSTVIETFSEMLSSFVEHLPYVFGSITALLLTWALTSLLSRFGARLFSHWDKRESVKELIIRLVSIEGWVLGLLLSAIILFPGLTPAKALGGLGLTSIAIGLAFKDIFEIFFAGILVLWRFPFEKRRLY